MPRAKKVVEAPKRRGRPPKKPATRTTELPPDALVFTYEQDPAEIQAIELALVRLRRIAATLRLATTGMDADQSDAVMMSSQLVDGAHEAIAEAVAMVREQRRM